MTPLIPDDVAARLPALYSQDGKGLDAMAVVKFFNPCGTGTWYVSEYDPTERLAFGLCDLGEPELGYVSIEELESIRIGRTGLTIERDLYWTPRTLGDCIKALAEGHPL